MTTTVSRAGNGLYLINFQEGQRTVMSMVMTKDEIADLWNNILETLPTRAEREQQAKAKASE